MGHRSVFLLNSINGVAISDRLPHDRFVTTFLAPGHHWSMLRCDRSCVCGAFPKIECDYLAVANFVIVLKVIRKSVHLAGDTAKEAVFGVSV